VLELSEGVEDIAELLRDMVDDVTDDVEAGPIISSISRFWWSV
jgi:hypothetical protein